MVRKTTHKFILKIIELSKVFFLSFFFWESVGKHVSQTSKYEKVWDRYIKDSVLRLFSLIYITLESYLYLKICSPLKELT